MEMTCECWSGGATRDERCVRIRYLARAGGLESCRELLAMCARADHELDAGLIDWDEERELGAG